MYHTDRTALLNDLNLLQL